MQDLSGQQLKGYEIQECIGAGGFGAVYRAYQPAIHREVAIKIILPGVAHHPDFVRRFEMEAQLVARLEHMNIVPLYDYWRDKDGAYLVMRWLRGGSLRDKLAHGACTLEETGRMVNQLTSALTTAHRNNVIHRDLKPANVVLDEQGNAYLSDFGIAKDNNSIDGSLTDADAVVGSLDYISPEQARSEPVTPRTDIYSLGVMVYEMLVGEHPFPQAKSIERLYKHLNERLPKITNLPVHIANGVNEVIQKATAKDPLQRYSNALEFANAFMEAAQLLSHPMGASVVELLTVREQEVLQLMMNNYSNKEIADQLVVSVNTVKYFQKQIYSKLRVRNRVQAIVRARELDLAIHADSRQANYTSRTTQLPEPTNPYKGLEAFQAADSQQFFGRERLVERIIKRLCEKENGSRFLAVVGPSGSGKSSVVKAGVIPALWRGELPGSDHWFIAEMTPGTHPLEELEIALSQISTSATTDIMQQLQRDERGLLRAVRMILPEDNSELMLVIDQFEEVFTQVEDEIQRASFLKLLFNAASDPRSRIRIIVTLRADFYDRPLRYVEFGEMLRNRMETVLPLSAEELERAIVTPARNEGVQFEEGLTAAIVSEVNYQPGALPMLQYALTELFERRKQRLLTREAYESIGGTVGALAQRADELYLELDDTGQTIVQQMFMRLVTLGEGTEDTRRRVYRSELIAVCSDADLLEEVIDTFVSYRLLSLDHDPITRTPTVEIAHEAILSVWKRLQKWINDNREEIRMQQQLTRMAVEWQEAQQDPSYLANGLRLEQMEAWAHETRMALSDSERRFLDASIKERNNRKKIEQSRKERELTLEAQSVQRLRLLVVTFALATGVAILLSAIAVIQRNTAQEQSQIAQQRANDIYSLSLVSAAQEVLDEGNTGLALSLALESVMGDTPSEETVRLLDTLAHQPGPIQAVYEGTFTTWLPSWDYRYLAIGKPDASIELVDTATNTVIRSLQGNGSAVVDMRFSFDNTLLLGLTENRYFILWDVETGEQSVTIRSPYYSPNESSLSFVLLPDNRRILYKSPGAGAPRLLDTETGNSQRTADFAREVPLAINVLAVQPDTHLAAGGGVQFIAGEQGGIVIWDIETQEVLYRISSLRITHPIIGIGFLNDTTLWASSVDETVLIDTATGNPVLRVNGRARQQFTLGTNRIATDYRGGTVWDLNTGQEIGHLPHADDAYILPDDNTILLASANRLEQWEIRSEYPLLQRFEGHQDWVLALAYSPDGHMALSGGGIPCETNGDNRLILWDAASGEALRELIGHEADISAITFSADGRYALSGATDGNAIFWDLNTGEAVRRLTGNAAVTSLTLTQDGQQAVIGYAPVCPQTNSSATAETLVWDIDTGVVIQQIASPLDSPYGWTLVGHDGLTVAFPVDNTISIVDVASGDEQIQIIETAPIVGMAFALDNQTLISGGESRLITQWDLISGAQVRTLDAQGVVGDIAVSPSGDFIAAVLIQPGQAYCQLQNDVEIVVWDSTGQAVRRWDLPVCGANWLKFSPDSQTLMIGSYGDVHIYAIEPQQALEWIRTNRYARDFTCDERVLYRIEPLCAEQE